MQKAKLLVSLTVVIIVFFVQVGGVFAAPTLSDSAPVTGIIQSITLETDATTGVTMVIVDLIDNNQVAQRVRISQKTAIALGIVVLNGDGKAGINNLALGKPIEIDPKVAIPAQEENQNPVGSALATFFSNIAGVDYEFIMQAREQGFGFGTIAQTLWLTQKLEGDATVFESLLEAKQTGDYSGFILEDGSTPQNWGQLKKAVLENDGSASIGVVMSNSHNNGNGVGNDKEKDNNGNGNDNGNNDNKDQVKDKEKDQVNDKEKDKEKNK